MMFISIMIEFDAKQISWAYIVVNESHANPCKSTILWMDKTNPLLLIR